MRVSRNVTWMRSFFARRKVGVGHCDTSVIALMPLDRNVAFITVLRDPVERWAKFDDLFSHLFRTHTFLLYIRTLFLSSLFFFYCHRLKSMYYYLMTRLYLRVQQKHVVQFVDHLNSANASAHGGALPAHVVPSEDPHHVDTVDDPVRQQEDEVVDMLLHHNYSMSVLVNHAATELRNATLRATSPTAWWQYVAKTSFDWYGNTSLKEFARVVQGAFGARGALFSRRNDACALSFFFRRPIKTLEWTTTSREH